MVYGLAVFFERKRVSGPFGIRNSGKMEVSLFSFWSFLFQSRNDDIEGSQPKPIHQKYTNKPFYYTLKSDDIENQKRKAFKSDRKPLNPADPKYDWPDPKPLRPVSAKKFIRDTLDISDIEKSSVYSIMNGKKERATNFIADIEGTSAKKPKVSL